MTTQTWIEIGKMVSPIFTVALAAFLAARYYEKNKRVDFSLKLSEKAVEEIYSPILVDIEKYIIQNGYYEGLSANDVKKIDLIFSRNRHLVDSNLYSILWKYQDEIRREFEIKLLFTGEESSNSVDEKFLDEDRKFLFELIRVRDEHLKKIGFYS